MDIGSLRCEFKHNPIGLGTLQPRLSWKLSSDRRGARQSAYRIVAESDERKIWDTGKVSSSQTHLIAYAGEALVSRQRVSWQVTVWDENDRSWSSAQPASWEMGLLDQDDW
ncbi:MAG: alpha-L-rhamnosidase, partial [Anaerolineae bacterium]|nr:alpha-L-rhamnosidase [Anaerolineae bacterium]